VPARKEGTLKDDASKYFHHYTPRQKKIYLRVYIYRIEKGTQFL